MPEPLRVAYTVEQCWHDVPGGTAIATLAVAQRLQQRPDVELISVAGRHRHRPGPPFTPTTPVQTLPLVRPWLYETWNRWNWPKVEAASGPIDVCHSTTAIPAATTSPHVVTVHDVAFVHTPERFTGHGARVMRAGLDRCRRADLVLCPSTSTKTDLVDLGFDVDQVRVVPWGVDPVDVEPAEIERVRATHELPERFVLFVGTVEPRKNLARLASAIGRLDESLPLVVAGAAGWGDAHVGVDDASFLGFVPASDLDALYAAATVFAYPSIEEGFGMPVAEAMAAGTPVVTSATTSTAEVAGGAAVLVDPLDVDSIAAGIAEALHRAEPLVELGRHRAAELSWDTTVEATVAAYREVAR